MEKAKKKSCVCELSFWENLLFGMIGLFIAVAIMCILGSWIEIITIRLSNGQFSEAFGSFVLGPMIVAGFYFFLAFCDTMGDSGDSW